MSLTRFALDQLTTLRQTHRERQLAVTESLGGVAVLHDGKRLISFCGNDYLGLTQHPQVKAAAAAALERYGTGAGASRLVTGNHPLYAALEAKLAAWKGTEAALVTGSGYLTNISILPVLAEKGDLLLLDKLAHACLLDGAQLSGATVKRFAHNNIEDCATLLQQHRAAHRHVLIVTETVFSMDGDRAPVTALLELAAAHDAWLLTDDAHGLGLLFPTPSAEHHIQMGTLSKAGGSYGGYIAASTAVVAYLRNTMRSVMFSTALPPMVIAAADAALAVMAAEPERCTKPLRLAQLFTSLTGQPTAESAIVPWIIGEEQAALATAAMLAEAGFLVSAIRPPTVPPHTARLRFTFSALHEEAQVQALAECMRTITDQ